MPKLNAHGQAVCGVGDGIVSVDHRPIILRAGGAAWLDDDTLLANALEPDGKWHVVRCHLPEALVIPIEDGANDLVAGGGRWLGWNPARGMFGSVVRTSAGVLAAGRDGTLAYCRDRQAGVDFVLNTPDGREYDVVGTIVYDMQVLGPQAAIWYDGRSIHAVGRPLPRFAVPPGRTRLVTLPDGDWLVYWSEGIGLVAQLDGARDGYVLETQPVAFNHDAVAVRGELVVCWSTTQGEGPNDLVTRIVARTAPRVPLMAPKPAPVPVPAPPAPIPIPTPPPRPTPPKEPPMPVKTNDEVRRDIAELVRFYNDPDGLNRAARGIPPPITVDDPAFWDWVALAVTTPIDQVKARIRTFPEWVEQHPNEQAPSSLPNRLTTDGPIFREG